MHLSTIISYDLFLNEHEILIKINFTLTMQMICFTYYVNMAVGLVKTNFNVKYLGSCMDGVLVNVLHNVTLGISYVCPQEVYNSLVIHYIIKLKRHV